MRHFKGLIPFCPFLLVASCVWADDIADRVSIDRVIAALNEVPVSPQLFTTDASSELGRLPKVSARNLRPQGAVPQRAGGPTVVISHEPWGEATIDFRGRSAAAPQMEVLNPRITNSAARFVTPDVAVVDGTWLYRGSTGARQTIPLFFVMKRDGSSWKIAALRVLESR